MDETTPQKYTIAHFAAQNGNLDIVKYVVEKDASVLTRKVEKKISMEDREKNNRTNCCSGW